MGGGDDGDWEQFRVGDWEVRVLKGWRWDLSWSFQQRKRAKSLEVKGSYGARSNPFVVDGGRGARGGYRKVSKDARCSRETLEVRWFLGGGRARRQGFPVNGRWGSGDGKSTGSGHCL